MQPATRYFLITVAPMATIVIIATAWAVSLLQSVPDPMAVHFDADFDADGYLSPMLNIALIVGLNLLTILGFVALARLGLWHGTAGRILAGASGATVTLLSVLLVEQFRLQVDLSDAAEAKLPAASFWISLGMATGVGMLLTWLATPVPRQSPTSPAATHPPAQDLTVWTGIVIMHAGIRTVLSLVAVMAIAFVFALPNWATILTAGVMIAAVWATWGWRLRIDPAGFTYRSFAGVPRGHLPHETIAAAELIDINPGDWGGWGWRKNSSGTGLITQSGSGIRITRTNGRLLEISTDDAATAVFLLQQYNQPTSSPGGQSQDKPDRT